MQDKMHSIKREDGFTPNCNDNDDGGHRDPSNHHQKFLGMVPRIALFVTLGIASFLLFQSSYSFELYWRSSSYSDPDRLKSSENRDAQNIDPTSSFQQYTSQNMSLSAKEAENNELKKTLSKAVMKDNKTVIITTLNAAWTGPNSTFDLFLESFRIGNGTLDLLQHVVVGAFDRKAYKRCVAECMHCVALTTDGVNFSGEASYMSKNYLKLVWRKIEFQRTVLELGYDFVFTDGDVMWLRNPFERLYPDGDFQVACDYYRFSYTDVKNPPNSGFIYAKSNNRTIRFYKYWYAGQEYYPGKHDQDVLRYIQKNPVVLEMGVEIRFLDTAYFSGFCEPSKDLDVVITMHATCCIGQKDKMNALKMAIHDWKRYVSVPPHQRNSTVRSWTQPKPCIR